MLIFPLISHTAPFPLFPYTTLFPSTNGMLDVGETWHYTASHTVTQADIDTNGGGDGTLDNVATAHRTGAASRSDDAHVPVAQNFALSIVKDGTVPGGTANVVGEVVSWTIDVSNAGNAAVSNVTVTDPLASNIAPVLVGAFNSATTYPYTTLYRSETWHYTASHTVTQADIDTNGGGDGTLDN